MGRTKQMEPQRPDVVRGSAEFGDSSSLSVHWSVISGFFNWAVGMDSIEKTPILSGRQNKQFAIPFKKKEIVPPTKQEV
jgi:hypothetical protein